MSHGEVACIEAYTHIHVQWIPLCNVYEAEVGTVGKATTDHNQQWKTFILPGWHAFVINQLFDVGIFTFRLKCQCACLVSVVFCKFLQIGISVPVFFCFVLIAVSLWTPLMVSLWAHLIPVLLTMMFQTCGNISHQTRKFFSSKRKCQCP